ncbi:CDP-diacylglycerol--glycerol-3-phosphate 3-phosphatidyltransferase [Georgenia sp. Z1491]|uniref:CDP-diacylglycerol--glycerol-3-phosphate 3-phosphatidyltransferase n=1 Tax=Georgenia sp. Z1491 TaxID=3416707 RepID=UPI003CE7C415
MTSSVPGAAQAPLWNIANILTMLRIVLVPVFVVLFLLDGDAMRWAAAAVFVVAAITDKLDGYLARSRNLVTDFGKLADPIADKTLVGAALVLLSWAGELPWVITIVILVRELAVTVLRDVMRRREVVMPASQGGKLKTVLQLVFISVMLVPWATFLSERVSDVLLWIALVIAWAAMTVALLSGIQYFVAAARAIREARGSGAGPGTSEVGPGATGAGPGATGA